MNLYEHVKWEYTQLTYIFPANIMGNAVSLGYQGWQLVTVMEDYTQPPAFAGQLPSTRYYTLLFKRPILPLPEIYALARSGTVEV